MNPRIILFISVALLGVLAGTLVSYYSQPGREEVRAMGAAVSTDLVGELRPPFTLGAVDGQRVSASDFDGNVLLINFWATWCEPCRAEMPMLAEVQRKLASRGLEIIGIALDDVQQARTFAEELGVTYTVLVGGADVMATGVVYGNRAGMLPYTVLVDRVGIIRWTHLGELDHQDLLARLKPLL